MKKNVVLTLSSQNIHYKLKIAFALMSILPLLVFIYIVSNYVLPNIGLKLDIWISIVISVLISGIGFFVVKEVMDRIISLATIAKLIAAGDINRTVEMERIDEVGDLGDSLNQMTQRIRDYMNELKGYSLKTTEINFEIQKRILVLSSLLQISSLIAQGVKLEEIIKLATEKSRLLADSDVSFLFTREEEGQKFSMKIADGIGASSLLSLTIDPNKEVFSKAIKYNKPLIIDKDNTVSDSSKIEFYDKFKVHNTVSLPIYCRGMVSAILGVGNSRDGYRYEKDDIDLLDIFAKQIAIAIENDLLLHQVEKLEIKDPLTGLYNKSYIVNRLEEEIKRAVVCQRPCAFVMINIDNFQAYKNNFGSLQSEATLRSIASLIRESVSEIDRVARFDDNEFALVLPEKNKRQAKDLAEEVRKKIEFSFSKEQEARRKLTVSGGVSENPLDGVTSVELIDKAKELLGAAKRQGKNMIVSFNEKRICQ
ncbi:MAG: diguanylate cyclase [Candidatus Omnitrophota bacterium]|jgi:diguanylate cyclase (GGDEF)-like protein|nr:MAG: diguanylate cyclase [Candidatus Omnitrophota bacterium]